jgi:hypothetical protein
MTDPPQFSELRRVRSLTAGFLGIAQVSLENYFDAVSGGFFHRLDENADPGDFSKASTATAVSFLVDCGRWQTGPWVERETGLAAAILAAPWSSAGLDEGNAFTVSYMLEALADLADVGADFDQQHDRIGAALDDLAKLLRGNGGISISGFPPSAYLTQLASRALSRWEMFNDDVRATVLDWAKSYLNAELVIIEASAKDADPLELAYAIVLIGTLSGDMVPAQREVLRFALTEFFDTQLSDGTWPRGRPIFYYPNVGNAYCYEYEVLVQVLGVEALMPYLHEHVGGLLAAADAVSSQKFPLRKGYGWSSGHHRHFRFPESWSSASVLHFCHRLNRYLAGETRLEIFEHVDAAMVAAPPTGPLLPPAFLDSHFQFKGVALSLKETIESSLLKPITDHAADVRRGLPLPKSVPSSAIFFGPPGTSKTQLAKLIASAVGWPLLVVDPSHLLRNGSENLHSEMYLLFRMLTATEQLVVLFDEFDELVRVRQDEETPESRFLTTAMLPRLQELSNERRVVFLFATNHVEVFDPAIRRPGRFDLIVPVMPPTASEKLRHWPKVAKHLDGIDAQDDLGIRALIDKLTFDEFASIAEHLMGETTKDGVKRRCEEAAQAGTLQSFAVKEKPWETFLAEQKDFIRIPKS